MNKTLSLAARAFAILFIIMTALFALDINKFSWLALLMHLLPTLILLIILLISLKYEKLGGVLWILAAIAYMVIAWGNVPWLAYLVMSGPAVIIGTLFLLTKNEMMHTPTTPSISPKPVDTAVSEEIK